MKVGGFESGMIQAPFAETSTMTSNNTSFQMILGATLANSDQILVEAIPNQELGSINELIDILIGNVETQFNEQEKDEIVTKSQETIHELFDWLKENVDPIHLPESIKDDEPLPEEFLAASVLLVQVINEVNKETLKSLPLDKITTYVKAVKEFLIVSKENVSSLSEMKQLEELEASMEKLLARFQELTKESKFHSIRKSLEHAFFKGNEISDVQLQRNSSNVLQSLLGKSPHDQLLNKHIVNSDLVINANPTIPTESFILHVSEPLKEETAMRGLIKEFSNILGRSSLTQGLNTTKLLIRLHPEELGTLRVELMQKDGQLTARILASTNKAKELLDFQLNNLRQAFTQQNISVDRIEVTYSQDNLGRYTNQDSRGSQQQQNEQNQDQKQSQSENNDNFKDALSNVLFETEV